MKLGPVHTRIIPGTNVFQGNSPEWHFDNKFFPYIVHVHMVWKINLKTEPGRIAYNDHDVRTKVALTLLLWYD